MAGSNPKTQKQRFADFKSGVCPYCGADGATLEKNKRGYRGACVVCKAENNFTNPGLKIE